MRPPVPAPGPRPTRATFPSLWLALLILSWPSAAHAHEPDHTHASLTAGAFWFLASPHVSAEAQARAVEGTIREDDCPLYGSHFYNPRTNESTISNAGVIACPLVDFTQQKAPDRARDYWNEAKQKYNAGHRLAAYQSLGHVFHLLQDMTSPSHCHNNPHGKINDRDCDQDDDDFENWGYCGSRDTKHIQDYWHQSAAVPTQRLRTNMSLLFPDGPQRANGANRGSAYVRHVANLVYDFTTFDVILTEENNQPNSELKRMFPSLADAVGGWKIEGDGEDIGITKGGCGRSEGALDIQEEWWPMENPDDDDNDFTDRGTDSGSECKITGNNANQRIEGSVFLENIGGGGRAAGNSDADEVVPKVWERVAGGREFYFDLYGTRANPAKRTMLRIYGDILYPVAIAYGAGLLESFVEEVVQPPKAVAGGPYVGECGVPITFDGSGSSDSNGHIVSYEWDFDGDGTYDQTTTTPTVEHVYHTEFAGTVRLRVTDDDETPFSDEDVAEVRILDTTAPLIAAIHASQATLWPPNHKMVAVDFTVDATDLCDASPVSRVLEILSSDPEDGKGGRHTTPDGVIRGDLSVDLRAEWSSGRNGRSYDVRIGSQDAAGNVAYATAVMRVARDRGEPIAVLQSVTIDSVSTATHPGGLPPPGDGDGGPDPGIPDDPGAAAPATFHLVGAVPNPSRGSGGIEFSLGGSAQATIVIFDIAGRIVRRLADETYSAGRHVIAWDGRRDGGVLLAPGVYWIRLDAGGSRMVRQLVMVH